MWYNSPVIYTTIGVTLSAVYLGIGYFIRQGLKDKRTHEANVAQIIADQASTALSISQTIQTVKDVTEIVQDLRTGLSVLKTRQDDHISMQHGAMK